LVNYRGKNFQISTQHQLQNLSRRASDIRLVAIVDGKHILFNATNGYTVGPQPAALANMQDVLVSRYPTIAQPHINRRFLRLEAEQFRPLHSLNAKRVIAHFFIGFPLQAVGYDLKDSGDALSNLRTRWVKLLVEPAPDAIQFVPNRLYFRTGTPLEEMGLDPDGISGSPIFCIYQDEEDQCRVCIGGMITHASKSGALAVYDPEPIRLLLDGIVVRPHTLTSVKVG
jgi:hypothetical protein